MVDKNAIFKALDARINKDLIQSVYDVRTMFNLTHAEFYPIFMEWYNS